MFFFFVHVKFEFKMTHNIYKKSKNSYLKNCKAYIQVLPKENLIWDNVKILNDKKTIYIRATQDFGKGKNVIAPNYWTFPTDGTFHNIHQNEIYNTVIDNLLEKVLNGNNLIVVGYGQTGTGKSFTISGLHNLYENRGIAPRILTELFNLKEKYKVEAEIEYSMSFIDITKTHFTDLLLKNSNRSQNFKVISKIKLSSINHGLELLFHGEGKRNIFYESPYISHNANSVLTIFIKCSSLLHSEPVIRYSEICIVDMVGCDNCGNETCLWKKCQETGVGNLAKTQLEQFLLTLKSNIHHEKVDKTKGYFVQYLSRILKPQSIIRFIGHIRTNKEDLLISLSVLRFSQLLRDIKPAKLSFCVEQSEKLEVENIKNEIEFLKKQIDLDAMLKNNDLSHNITESRVEHMKNIINEYILSKNAEITILNVSDVLLALKTFKEIYKNLESDYEDKIRDFELQMKLSSKLSLSVKEKPSRLQRNTIELQLSARRRKNSDKGSINTKEKSILKGMLDNSGVSLGKAATSSFQGSVVKSKKKLLSKTKIKVKKHRKSSETKSNLDSEKNFENTFSTISNDANSELKMKLPNYDEAWKSYTLDEEYGFVNLNNLLSSYEIQCRESLKIYNDLYRSIQEIISSIDLKKEDLLRVQMHKQKPIIQCPEETESLLLEAKTKLEVLIATLSTDLNYKRENLLTIQADLKVNIEEYHRIKKNIIDDFTKYCVDKFNIQVTNAEPGKSVEDNLNILPSATLVNTSEEKEEEHKKIFYRLQKEMRKMIEKFRKVK